MSADSRDAANGLPRGFMILAGLAAITLAVAGLKAIASLLGPALLALALVITVYPARHWLDRKGLPGWVGSLVVVLAVYVILILMLLALVMSVGKIAAMAPTYAPQIHDLVTRLGNKFQSLGVQPEQVHSAIKSLNVGKLVSLAGRLLAGTFGLLTNLVLIATLVLFFGFDSVGFARSLNAVRRQRPMVADALSAFASGTRRYFVVSALFGFVVAVIDGIALAFIGIPGVLVWAVLAFVTNFIPNVGFVIGLVPPALIGLLNGGLGTMIVVIVVYSVINFVIQTVLQPKIIGDALGLSASLTFVSLLFWAWVLGPIGAVLAVPMTLLVKAVLVDVDPRAGWLSPLVSGNVPEDSTPSEDTAT